VQSQELGAYLVLEPRARAYLVLEPSETKFLDNSLAQNLVHVCEVQIKLVH
jgi:hypothetical protein